MTARPGSSVVGTVVAAPLAAVGRSGWPRDLAWAVAAAGCLAASGRPWGPWWAAVVAGALLWRVLLRAPAGRAAVLAAVALLPVPAIGYEGLRVHDPRVWWAVTLGVAAAYGLVGGLAAALADRAWPAAPIAWRPLPWALGWFGLDLLATDAQPWPWPFPLTPGYALIGGPYVALAALAGPAGLGLAWVVLGCAAAFAAPRRRGRCGAAPPRGAGAWWLAAVGLTVTAFGLQARVDRLELGAPRTVALLQLPGTGEPLARDATGPTPADAARLAAFAARAGALTADLHVWPEIALGTALAGGTAPLARVARELGAPVLAGAFRRDDEGGWRNAVALADRHGAVFAVDKRWLVPGYEGWLTAGVGERWPVRAAGWRIGVLLCWESLFPDLAAARVRAGADVLAVLAHDGWAAGTATPWWHARAARLIAWSVGRPVLFASHDGPSMVWGHDGRLLAEAGAGPAALTAVLAAPRAWRTPYLAVGGAGLAVAWWAALAGLAGVAWNARRARPRAAPAPPGAQGCGASGPHAA